MMWDDFWREVRKQFHEDPQLKVLLILGLVGLAFALLLLWSIS